MRRGGWPRMSTRAVSIPDRLMKPVRVLPDTSGMIDPDLLIRTAGEMRISNFLLWQISYTELWITPTLWPDFRKDDLMQACSAYAARERKFGGLPAASGER